MLSVGIIGLGEMGYASAERLTGKSCTVVGFDPDRERAAAARRLGVTIADSPAAVVSGCSGPVLLNVGTITHAETAWHGADGALTRIDGRTLVLMSTFSKPAVQRMAAEARAAGGHLLDATHSGSRPAARTGTLVFWLAGDPTALDAARPVLELLGEQLHVVGAEPGMAQVVKLINAVGLAVSMTAVAEMIAMAQVHGIDDTRLMSVIELSSGSNYVTTNWDWVEPMITTHNVENLCKDLRAALVEATEADLSTPVTAAAAYALRSTWPRVP
jgi:3-hydroxyisobutyrate dehydrogenase-like beta-hydroxyacid dehydrogenase